MNPGDREDGELICHTSCRMCDSSDALAVYQKPNGSYDGHCFSCNKFMRLDDDFEIKANNNMNQYQQQPVSLDTVKSYGSQDLPERGLRKDVLDYYGVKTTVNTSTGACDEHYYPIHANGHLTGFKRRRVADKSFYTLGSGKNADLFGQHLFPNSNTLLVVEGELDALSAFQMCKNCSKNNRPWKVVSLPFGADSKSVKRNLEWLEGFQKIILALDADKPGQKASEEISEMLSPGKAYTVSWPTGMKDASDMLQAGREREFYNMLWEAAPRMPAGIVSGQETWTVLHNRPKKKSLPFPDGWEANGLTYGIRRGELDTWTSGSGSGKTQIMRELQYHILHQTDDNLGIIALEEPLADTVEGLMALYLEKRIQLPDVPYDTEEYKKAWDFVAGSNRIHLYDHFGSTDADTLFNKIRYLAKGLDCKYIFLDHLSIVVSEFAAEGDERRQIDSIMTKLKHLTQELDIWIGLVVHLRKANGATSFEEGAVPSVDDLRGSGSIKQLSNSVYATARNQQHGDPYCRNTSSIHVLKCRYTGRTGPAGWLHFQEDTGRMLPVPDPEEDLALRSGDQARIDQQAAQDAGII